jgi:hypothetical protein
MIIETMKCGSVKYFKLLDGKKPVFTINRAQAHEFTDLTACKGIRDLILEKVDKANILLTNGMR